MQEAIPFRSYVPATATSAANGGGGSTQSLPRGMNSIENLLVENSVVVFGNKGCCMCHVVKRLLQGLGVNPAVFEVEEAEEAVVTSELRKKSGEEVKFPVVFVGGKMFGGLERVMAMHISGELVPILKDAGALWL